jgi:prepilin-type N-terminal cleavage/methylation domain-containing protein
MTGLLKYNPRAGYTLIEMAITIALLGILAAVSIPNFMSMNESRDARMVESAQSTLQQVISQASNRRDVSPGCLMGSQTCCPIPAACSMNHMRPQIQAAVINSIDPTQGRIQFTVPSATSATMTIVSTGRTATYTIDPAGNVSLANTGLGGFTRFQALNGGIAPLNGG